MAKGNGNGLLLKAIGAFVAIALAVCGYVARETGAAETKIEATDTKLTDHKESPGHPVLIERVDGISRKLDVIEMTQHEQTGKLNQILRAVEKG